MRRICCGVAMTVAVLSTAATGWASLLLIEAQQVGGDVVFSMSGTIDIAGLTQGADSSHSAGIDPTGGSVGMGAGATDSYSGFDVVPGGFGSGGNASADSSSGNHFAITNSALYVPDGFVSGSSLNGTMTFSNATFASLGLTQDIYVWVWGEAEGFNKISLEIFSEVPEPSTWLIWLATAGVCATSCRRRPPVCRTIIPNRSA